MTGKVPQEANSWTYATGQQAGGAPAAPQPAELVIL
jgi:hypothetical protein